MIKTLGKCICWLALKRFYTCIGPASFKDCRTHYPKKLSCLLEYRVDMFMETLLMYPLISFTPIKGCLISSFALINYTNNFIGILLKSIELQISVMEKVSNIGQLLNSAG